MSEESKQRIRETVRRELQVIGPNDTPRCHICKRKVRLSKNPARIIERDNIIYKFNAARCYNCYNINHYCIRSAKESEVF